MKEREQGWSPLEGLGPISSPQSQPVPSPPWGPDWIWHPLVVGMGALMPGFYPSSGTVVGMMG